MRMDFGMSSIVYYLVKSPTPRKLIIIVGGEYIWLLKRDFYKKHKLICICFENDLDSDCHFIIFFKVFLSYKSILFSIFIFSLLYQNNLFYKLTRVTFRNNLILFFLNNGFLNA